MARKTVLVCDQCGNEVEEGKGAVQRVTFNDARRGAKQADLCDSCAATSSGHQVARRGRKPKALTAWDHKKRGGHEGEWNWML